MVEFRKGRLFWLNGALCLAVLLLGLYNAGQFRSDGVIMWEQLIRFAASYLLMTAALLTKIDLPGSWKKFAAGIIFIAAPWLTFETVMVIIGIRGYA